MYLLSVSLQYDRQKKGFSEKEINNQYTNLLETPTTSGLTTDSIVFCLQQLNLWPI